MIQNFEAKLAEYADLIVRVGAAVQPGQPVMVTAQIMTADLARAIVEKCYAAGAPDVLINWNDDTMTRLRYLHADGKVFDRFDDWRVSMYDMVADKKYATIAVIGSDPESLKGVDPSRIQRSQKTSGEKLERFYSAQMASEFQWTMGAYATPSWARKVFPGLPEGEAVENLWQAIFTCCRIEGDGKAAERWKAFTAAQKARVAKLNAQRFDRLIFKNSLGTNLVVGLPDNHLWAGASEISGGGVEFVANIPTEEIFTAPHRERVDGIVHSAMPLVLNGNIVDKFWLRFERGKIVEAHAETGGEFLQSTLDIDEGARFLGEVALVPYSSPIRKSGVLFYNTLFDENASCHLAFGSAYPSCVKGAEKLDKEARLALGLNHSYTHNDFMVGTSDLSVTGMTAEGNETAVFTGGEWSAEYR